ncbi:uncharacterized protein LOC132043059 [Lycium ferocissimum]|uniref:uncharacterized protein LOC132043059 n=1 Tax=Lycium ferocissimum TaxID=112874 RepID=UPI002814F4C1|nr:uncharacterized protein LOC132043059 [Lycium ferocissimum]
MELLKDYDISILYLLGKATSMGSLVHLIVFEHPLAMEVQTLANNFVRLNILVRGILAFFEVRLSLLEQIRTHQFEDAQLCKIRDKAELGTQLDFSTTFHSQTDGQSERTIQFSPLAAFMYNNIYHSSIDMALFEALYCRRYRSPFGWFDAFEKMYVDRKVWDLEFWVGEQVLLKISPMKGVMGFGKRGKLSQRYLGPFEILRRVGDVAYELALPLGQSGVHPVFHVSMLKKYHSNGTYIVRWDSVLLDENLTYEDELIAILYRRFGS